MKVRLDHLSKRFVSLRGRHYALRDISLEISDREFFVLLGPSGCGKSTMLNLIAGLEKPTEGEIRFEDKLVASTDNRIFIPPRQRNVAMVFQSYALYPHMNVFDNIAFPLRIAHDAKGEIERAVHKTADMLQVTDLLKAKPAELSGGQRQRVAIARAIVRRPGLFLLDEPLSNLDAQLRLSMRTELKKLQRELQITTLYVTHDQIEAMTLGDRIAVLKNGGIEQIGTPEELYSRPMNTFVATFVGSPPMNLLDADVSFDDGGVLIKIGPAMLRVPRDVGSRFSDLNAGTVTVGIRPEDVGITGDDDASSAIEATVETVETLGRERLLHLTVAGQRLAILTGEAGCKRGQTVRIVLDAAKLHLFRD
jgi:multiple sugar transport system ATP-binding protein